MKTMTKRLKTTTVIAGFATAAFAAVVLLPGTSAAVRTPVGDGTGTFKAKCAACHGADGSGNTVMGKKMAVRDLRSAEVQKQSDAQLTGIIAKGKGKMPPFGKSLSGDQIRELVAHIRMLRP